MTYRYDNEKAPRRHAFDARSPRRRKIDPLCVVEPSGGPGAFTGVSLWQLRVWGTCVRGKEEWRVGRLQPQSVVARESRLTTVFIDSNRLKQTGGLAPFTTRFSLAS